MVQVGKGIKERVEVIAEEDVGSIVEKGQEKKITMEKRLPAYVDAPVVQGQKLGEIRVYNDGDLVKEVNLVAAEDIPRSGLLKEILKMLAETYLL